MITGVVITLVLEEMTTVTVLITTRLQFSAHSRVNIDNLPDLGEHWSSYQQWTWASPAARRWCHEEWWWWGILSGRWSDYMSAQDLMTWFDDKNCRDMSQRKNETTTQLHGSAKVWPKIPPAQFSRGKGWETFLESRLHCVQCNTPLHRHRVHVFEFSLSHTVTAVAQICC